MINKIFITGACGFVGSHLTEFFIENNYNVIAFDRYNSNGDLGWLNNSKYKNDIEFILGDIRDYDSVYKAMSSSNSCIHLAALIGIPYSYISPLAYIKTNVEGSYNVLESSKNLNLENIIITSTSETYGSAQYIPMDEKHPLVGQSPYSASKIAADQLSISYNRSFDLPVKIIRPFNVYGPRQSTRAIIPTIISQLLLGQQNIKLGNLDAKRDFTYVTDLCEAYLSIYKNENVLGDVINVGSNKNISIENLFNLIKEITKSDINITEVKERLRPNKSEVNELMCDNSLILDKLEWSPKINIRKGLEDTIQWINDNKEKYNLLNYHV